jgi:hypothetical protein
MLLNLLVLSNFGGEGDLSSITSIVELDGAAVGMTAVIISTECDSNTNHFRTLLFFSFRTYFLNSYKQFFSCIA